MAIPPEVWDVIKIALGTGGGVVLYKIDRNQSELFGRMREMETAFSELKGGCDARHPKQH